MKLALGVAVAGLVAGLVSFSGAASAAPVGPSRVVAPAGSLHVEAKAKRGAVVRSTRGMRKIPQKKGL